MTFRFRAKKEHLQGFKVFHLKARAGFWSEMSYMCLLHPTTAPGLTGSGGHSGPRRRGGRRRHGCCLSFSPTLSLSLPPFPPLLSLEARRGEVCSITVTGLHHGYRGTLLTRNQSHLGPYSRCHLYRGTSVSSLQGYLAQKKQRPPRTLQ